MVSQGLRRDRPAPARPASRLSGGQFGASRTPGYIVGVAGPLVGALVFVGAVALLGAFSYIFITGDVHRIELTEKT